jgi:hypothetical protein
MIKAAQTLSRGFIVILPPQLISACGSVIYRLGDPADLDIL